MGMAYSTKNHQQHQLLNFEHITEITKQGVSPRTFNTTGDS
jgi:hypothetical protein